MEVDALKTLLLKKDLEFLLKSNIINEYTSLKKFLIKIQNKIKPKERKVTLEDLKTCNSEIRRIFKNNIHAEILKQARNEWIFKDGMTNPLIIENTQKENRPCQYCGHRPLTEVYYIENVFNHNILEIGNQCIVSLDIKTKKEMDKINNNVKKIRRTNLIDSIFSSIKESIKDYQNYIINMELVIPTNILIPYVEAVEKLNGLYSRYIDHKTPNKNLKQIQTQIGLLLDKIPSLRQAIEIYVTENRSNILCAKKKYYNYIKDKAAYEDMEKTGFVGKLSISYIFDEEFMSKLIPRFNQALAIYNIDITGTHKNGYLYHVKERKETFYILHNKMIGLLGEAIYFEKIMQDFKTTDMISQSTFDDIDSFNIAISWLLHDTSYDFEIDLDFNEVIFYSKYKPPRAHLTITDYDLPKDSILHTFTRFFKKFLQVLVTRQGKDTKQIIDYIYNNGERVVYAEYINSRII